jgi:hypothetical protein
MTKHICSQCNYETDRSDNFKKHIDTKKHIKNVEKFAAEKQNNKQVKNVEDAANIIIKNQETQAKQTQMIEKKLDKIIHTSASLINYLLIHHPNAPVLKEISDETCKTLLLEQYDLKSKHLENYRLQRNMIRDHSSDNLINVIKNTILKIIIKENIEEQSIFNTDATRLNYVIKTSINKWKQDKTGINFNKLVINPILQTILTLLTEYLDKLQKSTVEHMNKLDNFEKVTNLDNESFDKTNLAIISTKTVIENIKKNKYNKILMRDLTPYLRFESKSLDDTSNKQDNIKDISNNEIIDIKEKDDINSIDEEINKLDIEKETDLFKLDETKQLIDEKKLKLEDINIKIDERIKKLKEQKEIEFAIQFKMLNKKDTTDKKKKKSSNKKTDKKSTKEID